MLTLVVFDRLFTLIEWVKEMLLSPDTSSILRPAKGDMNFHDKVFVSELNKQVDAAKTAYDKMLFKEALRTGFFEMQKARDKYRELCAGDGMRTDLVHRFIEWQAIVLSPICPHVSEHLWSLLGKKGLLLKDTKWPKTGPVDENVINKSEYLMEAAREFRLKLKNYMQPPKAKKGA